MSIPTLRLITDSRDFPPNRRLRWHKPCQNYLGPAQRGWLLAFCAGLSGQRWPASIFYNTGRAMAATFWTKTGQLFWSKVQLCPAMISKVWFLPGNSLWVRWRGLLANLHLRIFSLLTILLASCKRSCESVLFVVGLYLLRQGERWCHVFQLCRDLHIRAVAPESGDENAQSVGTERLTQDRCCRRVVRHTGLVGRQGELFPNLLVIL